MLISGANIRVKVNRALRVPGRMWSPIVDDKFGLWGSLSHMILLFTSSSLT